MDRLVQSLGEIIKKRRNAAVEVIHQSVVEYPISLEYIFTANGEILNADKNKWSPKCSPVDASPLKNGKTKSTNNEKIKVPVRALASPALSLDSGKTKSTPIIKLFVPVPDTAAMICIPAIDISVAVGTAYNNPDYLTQWTAFRYPVQC